MDFPSRQQVEELPLQLRMNVPREWEDRNGHVNVQHYLGLYELGGWVLFEDAGFDEAWFSGAQVSMFDLEHHLNFRAEMIVGDQVSTYHRLLSRSERMVHGLYLVVNDSRERLAATIEYVSACVDMQTRRVTGIPESLAEQMDRLIGQHAGLSWTPPLCGSMKP
jgi:acyl-CoA thioester hydrolase